MSRPSSFFLSTSFFCVITSRPSLRAPLSALGGGGGGAKNSRTVVWRQTFLFLGNKKNSCCAYSRLVSTKWATASMAHTLNGTCKSSPLKSSFFFFFFFFYFFVLCMFCCFSFFACSSRTCVKTLYSCLIIFLLCHRDTFISRLALKRIDWIFHNPHLPVSFNNFENRFSKSPNPKCKWRSCQTRWDGDTLPSYHASCVCVS